MADPAYIDADGVLTDGEAWVAVASATIAGSPANVTFTSTNDGQVGDWSQYMDLFIVCYKRSGAGSGGYTYITLNGDSSAIYSNQYFQGNGASVSAGVQSAQTGAWLWRETISTDTANDFDCGTAHFFDINSGKYKSILSMSAQDDGDADGYIATYANTYASQAPITSIEIPPYGGTGWAVGSRFDLFGILPRMGAV